MYFVAASTYSKTELTEMESSSAIPHDPSTSTSDYFGT